MGIKIPKTQECDDTTASEDKRLIRGFESRVSVILKCELVKDLFTFIYSCIYEIILLIANVTEDNEPILIVQYRRVYGNHPETLVCEP